MCLVLWHRSPVRLSVLCIIRYAMGIIGLVQRILGDSMQLTELEAGVKSASKTQQRTTPYCHNYTRTICTVCTHD